MQWLVIGIHYPSTTTHIPLDWASCVHRVFTIRLSCSLSPLHFIIADRVFPFAASNARCCSWRCSSATCDVDFERGGSFLQFLPVTSLPPTASRMLLDDTDDGGAVVDVVATGGEPVAVIVAIVLPVLAAGRPSLSLRLAATTTTTLCRLSFTVAALSLTTTPTPRLRAVVFVVDDGGGDDAEDADDVGWLLLGLAGPFGVPAIAKPAVGDGCPPSVPCTARQRRNIVRPMTSLTKLMVRPFADARTVSSAKRQSLLECVTGNYDDDGRWGEWTVCGVDTWEGFFFVNNERGCFVDVLCR